MFGEDTDRIRETNTIQYTGKCCLVNSTDSKCCLDWTQNLNVPYDTDPKATLWTHEPQDRSNSFTITNISEKLGFLEYLGLITTVFDV